jgi:peptide/nickel transport system ATP-binding protein
MVFSAGPPVAPAALFMGRPVLELEQLRLRYPGSEHWTLDGLI